MYTEVTISVRNLVEFLLRSGDIDNRTGGGAPEVMQEGSRMHRKLQQEAGEDYQAEVPLQVVWTYKKRVTGLTDEAKEELPGDAAGSAQRPVFDKGSVVVQGRADGIFNAKEEPAGWTIDEIKTTYRRLRRMKKPEPVHLAQAKCYAFMYARQNGLSEVNVRMTYCNLQTQSIRYWHYSYGMEELTLWFAQLMEEYRKWAEYALTWQIRRTASILDLHFPFPYREGQKSLVAAVYRTIENGRRLFLEAPTGTGKTISTLYPSLKAMGAGMAEKIFYLTAKTITGKAAQDTLDLLRQQGLLCKSVTLTAKEKMCVLPHPDCSPDKCPRAKGHFDRINDALFALLTKEDSFTPSRIAQYAELFNVCPFEMSLDMSLFSDLIVGDYNYLFDPHAYLRRFFGDGTAKKPYIFLIDEAHNLVDRGREMYSASLYLQESEKIKEISAGIYPGLSRAAAALAGKLRAVRAQMRVKDTGKESEGSSLLKELPDLRTEEMDSKTALRLPAEPTGLRERTKPEPAEYETAAASSHSGVSADTQQRDVWQEVLMLDDISGILSSTYAVEGELGEILASERILFQMGAHRKDPLWQAKRRIHDRILQYYWDIEHFLLISALRDQHYTAYAQRAGGDDLFVRLYCLDPRENLRQCMNRGRAAVLFSATLLPVQYYKAVLGGEPTDYEIYARSVFNPDRMKLMIVRDVTSRYSSRSAEQFRRIADCIHGITGERCGNYMVFFPSYQFMNEVADIYENNYLGGRRNEIVPSSAHPSEAMPGVNVLEKDNTSLTEKINLSAPEPYSGGPPVHIIRQQKNMTDKERALFLHLFEKGRDEESLIGFCVLGGVFGEGIDLRNDQLIGALIVGTGLPLVSPEREMLRQYYSRSGENGYAYAYTYPGMNKVMQAAGRVIRTADDIGIVALLDDRFVTPGYRRLFPQEWAGYEETTTAQAPGIAEHFWNDWL